MFEDIVRFIRKMYSCPDGIIPLHEPHFIGKEKEYLNDCINTTYVSSVGKYVDLFEDRIKNYLGVNYAIATTNGTCALHIALVISGVQKDELVLTQPLSFIATSNATSYIGASPVYVDIDKQTLGMSDEKLYDFLKNKTIVKNNGKCYHKDSGKRIAACVPIHTFGHPVKIKNIVELCMGYRIPVIEDAAESIGSTYMQKHTGTFGLVGIYSFNGNKTITCGGGGMVVTNNEHLGKLCKHLTTQAKIPHQWNYEHDYIGYNYRMPNINAALACAQLENLDNFISNKRKIAEQYSNFFRKIGMNFFTEPEDCNSNYWLNSIFLKDMNERDEFLRFTNENGIMTRPCWTLMTKLKMYKNCISENIENAIWVEGRLVNIPSSTIIK